MPKLVNFPRNFLIDIFRFEEKSHTFEQLDLQLRKLHASTEALSEFRKSLAQSTGSLSKSLAILSGSEENSGMECIIFICLLQGSQIMRTQIMRSSI